MTPNSALERSWLGDFDARDPQPPFATNRFREAAIFQLGLLIAPIGRRPHLGHDGDAAEAPKNQAAEDCVDAPC